MNVSAVDFLRRRVNLERRVQKLRGGPPELRPPKYGSTRKVFVPDELLQMLSQQVEEHQHSLDGWLFTRADLTRPISPTSVPAWWQRTARAAGIEGVTIQALRHYFASGLIAADCDVVTVQRALGHKSLPSR